MSTTTKVLLDVPDGLWIDEFSLSPQDGYQLKGSQDWSVRKYRLRGGVSDGVDVVEIDNGQLSVSLLPTRGMGLWKGKYRGLDLGWKSPVPLPVNPAFVDLTEKQGLGWLRGFNEWLCRCGLEWNGPPGKDIFDGKGPGTELTLHGRIANTPAHYLSTAITTEGQGNLSVTGIVDETMMFGPQLRLISTVETEAGSNRLRISDDITNVSGHPVELQLLYHTNFGQPFLEEGARFIAPLSEVAPRDARAAEGIDTFETYEKPLSGYTEQGYFMELLGNEENQTLALLKNAQGNRGVSLHFHRLQLPYFTLWKNTQLEADGYVTGLEPGTNFPNLKAFERQQGRVVNLTPGECYRAVLEIAVHDSAEAVSAIEREIEDLQGETSPQVHPQPLPTYSPPE